MCIPRLKQCCCGCSLRTGTKFIAWFGLITGSFFMVYYMLAAMYASVLEELGRSGKTEEEAENEIIESIVVCLQNFLRVIFSLGLLEGVHKGTLNLLISWVVYTLMALVIDTLCILIITIMGLKISYIYQLELIFGLCVYTYFVLIVYSDYREEKDREKYKGEMV